MGLNEQRTGMSHPIPTDLEAAKALSSCPAALDLFTGLSYRCFTARGRERVPLWGLRTGRPTGDRSIRPTPQVSGQLEGWLDLVRTMRPDCPAEIDHDGTGLYVDRAHAMLSSGESYARA